MCDEQERSGDVFNAANQPGVSFGGRFRELTGAHVQGRGRARDQRVIRKVGSSPSCEIGPNAAASSARKGRSRLRGSSQTSGAPHCAPDVAWAASRGLPFPAVAQSLRQATFGWSAHRGYCEHPRRLRVRSSSTCTSSDPPRCAWLDSFLVDNMRVAIRYTGDLIHPARDEYDLAYYLRMARQLEAAGAHILGIADMAGLCRPAGGAGAECRRCGRRSASRSTSTPTTPPGPAWRRCWPRPRPASMPPMPPWTR